MERCIRLSTRCWLIAARLGRVDDFFLRLGRMIPLVDIPKTYPRHPTWFATYLGTWWLIWLIYLSEAAKKTRFSEIPMGNLKRWTPSAQSRILTISLITSNSLTRVRPSSSANSQSWWKYCWWTKSGEKVIFCFTWPKNSLTYLGSWRSYIGQWRYLLPMRGTRGWSKSASLTNHLLRRGSYTSKTSTKNPGLCQSSDVGSNTSAAEDLRIDLWRKRIYYSGQHLGIGSGYQN